MDYQSFCITKKITLYLRRSNQPSSRPPLADQPPKRTQQRPINSRNNLSRNEWNDDGERKMERSLDAKWRTMGLLIRQGYNGHFQNFAGCTGARSKIRQKEGQKEKIIFFTLSLFALSLHTASSLGKILSHYTYNYVTPFIHLNLAFSTKSTSRFFIPSSMLRLYQLFILLPCFMLRKQFLSSWMARFREVKMESEDSFSGEQFHFTFVISLFFVSRKTILTEIVLFFLKK